MIEKIKVWLKTAWLKFKTWCLKNWFIIINYIVIFFAYNIVYDKPQVVFAEFLLGLWMFVSIATVAYKWFTKKK